MKIVNRDTLAKMPIGTLFCEYKPDYLFGDFEIITDHINSGFSATLPLTPAINIDDGAMTNGAERITNWATLDTCYYDFDKDCLFAVFSKTEIRAMITVLQYALSDCNFNITKFMDTYYIGENEIDEENLDKWI